MPDTTESSAESSTPRSGMPLCTYSRSEILAHQVLPQCPLSLSDAEHDYCPCRQRRNVKGLRVLACLFPVTHRGQMIHYPAAFGKAVAQRAREAMAAERRENNAHEQDDSSSKTDSREEEHKTVTTHSPVPGQRAAGNGESPHHRPLAPPPLWPQPIPIIGVTGEYASGKTLFGLTICPGPQTLVYDAEKSAESYQQLGFDRVDVPKEMMRQYPGGYKPLQVWLWWQSHVLSQPAGKYRVIILDTISEIENGLAEWVKANPGHFGRTAAQYLRMSGLMWADMKVLWKQFLQDLASRCETFVFVAHLKQIWSGDKPTGKKEAKGKDVLFESASLYLHMERKADSKGKVPEKPAAIVLKTRQAHLSVNPETGEVDSRNALPPRIPVATPAEIRKYLATPFDWSKLRKEELAPEVVLSEDEKLQLRAATAEAEAEAARLQLEAIDRAAQKTAAQNAASQTPSQPQVQSARPTPATPAQNPKPPAPPAASVPSGTPVSPVTLGKTRATPEQLEAIADLRQQLWDLAAGEVTPEELLDQWKATLAKRGVQSARDLSTAQAEQLIAAMRHQLQVADLAEHLPHQPEDTPLGEPGGGDAAIDPDAGF